MEAPPPGTTYYLDGLPLVRVEPVSGEDRVMVERLIAESSKRRLRILLIVGAPCTLLALWSLLFIARPGLMGVALDVMVPAMMPFFLAEWLTRGNPQAAEAKEKWIFEGSRPSFPPPLGLLSLERPLLRRRRRPPVVILQPGNVTVQSDKRLKQVQQSSFVRVNTDSTGTDSLTEGGLQEVNHGWSRIMGQVGLSVITFALTFALLTGWLLQGLPSEFWKQLLVAACIVALFDSVRILATLVPRSVKLMFAARHTKLIRLSVLSPAYLATADSTPDLEGALRQIEVVDNGMLWTVDDRPAAWRIYGTEPVFIRPSALALPTTAPSSLSGESPTSLSLPADSASARDLT